MRAAAALIDASWAAQRGHLFPWVPVLFGCGIGLFFALRFEPPMIALVLVCLGGVLALAFPARRLGAAAPVVIAAGCVAAGFAAAGARTHWVAGPVLDFRYYGPIEGRIVGIDRSASDAVRLTLDRVVLERMAPDETPARVRVSLHGEQGWISPQPGATVILTGHLSAPGGAVEPGGFDFRRHAWFQQLGAVGYTRSPVLLLEPPGAGQVVFKARMWLSERVRSALPEETGAFAAAITAGDRSAMGQETLQDLRDTNLAHLLAISGLHMGLLAGFVFGALRLGLVLVPPTRHLGSAKKVAAAGALIAATGYLALSGGNVATERAYVMAAVALFAVMANRRALSLRSVALAALIVLVLRPEALLSPGFQMSFAATTALVAAFEALTAARAQSRAAKWFAPVLSLLVSSVVAGAATAPVAMAHFNMVAHYGLIANLTSVPVMGAVVVPMAVVAALLMPLGLDWLALQIMGLGLDWILLVARMVADWEGAVRPIVSPEPVVLPLIAAGGLILCLWQGRGRFFGIPVVAVAAATWAGTERPHLLIADTGALVGLMTEDGRALSRMTGAGFVAGVWLENDGDRRDQEAAAMRWPGPRADRSVRAGFFGYEVVHLQGRVAAQRFSDCAAGQIVIATEAIAPRGPCRVIDAASLAETGSLAIWLENDGLRIESDLDHAGRRLWRGGTAKPVRLVAGQD
jgi:competence protein ComEC